MRRGPTARTESGRRFDAERRKTMLRQGATASRQRRRSRTWNHDPEGMERTASTARGAWPGGVAICRSRLAKKRQKVGVSFLSRYGPGIGASPPETNQAPGWGGRRSTRSKTKPVHQAPSPCQRLEEVTPGMGRSTMAAPGLMDDDQPEAPSQAGLQARSEARGCFWMQEESSMGMPPGPGRD